MRGTKLGVLFGVPVMKITLYTEVPVFGENTIWRLEVGFSESHVAHHGRILAMFEGTVFAKKT